MHIIKAYIENVKDGSLSISTSIDKMFGRLGFHSNILTKKVDDILNDCGADLQFWKDNYKKWWIYNETNESKGYKH